MLIYKTILSGIEIAICR